MGSVTISLKKVKVYLSDSSCSDLPESAWGMVLPEKKSLWSVPDSHTAYMPFSSWLFWNAPVDLAPNDTSR